MAVPVRTLAALAAGALAAALAPALPTTAAQAHSGIVVLYDKLNNPRGLAFGPGGAILVAEAGTGGAGPCMPGPEGGEVCFGTSGSLGRLWHGRFTRPITGLPSIAEVGGTSAIGPSDVAVRGGRALLTVGLGAAPAVRASLPAAGQRMGRVYSLAAGGHAPSHTLRELADIAGYEQANNPDGGELNSNPQAVAFGTGYAAVSDAGGNALIGVSRHGVLTTLAVFPDRQVPAPPFLNLPPGTMIPMQSVPTGVAFHQGAYYVAELTGFPFPVGAARIHKVVPGQAPQVVASGLTNVIDLAFDAHGNLYALEIAHNSLLDPQPRGALLRIRPGQAPEVVLGDLNFPGGLAIRGGYAYMTDCSVCPGTGRLLKVRL